MFLQSFWTALLAVAIGINDAKSVPISRPRVTHIFPRSGSIAGGTRLTLFGQGFSNDTYKGGNRVMLFNMEGQNECDILLLHTSSEMIVCFTREAFQFDKDSQMKIKVYSNDGSGFQHVDVCRWCTFTYRISFTPFLRGVSPLAFTSGEEVTLSGDLFAVGFGDPDDTEDSDKDNAAPDLFVRILVGGRGCNHTNENDTAYGAKIDDRGVSGSITCHPFYRIASMNVTAILAFRGSTFVHPNDNLYSIDNNLEPYHIQGYADILQVIPNRGSIGGGTKIFVLVSGPLQEYAEDPEEIKVVVGGIPCKDVAIHPTTISSTLWNLTCTSGPQPTPAKYYPGHRGVQREVWLGRTNFHDFINNSINISLLQATHERLFLHSDRTTAEFGENVQFSQRFRGFFIPPLTSLYTFNIMSDDQSKLYVSTDGSTENMTLMAQSQSRTNNRWDTYASQLSSPVLLEADRPYYFELYGNQYLGPWSLGMGVKLHNASFNKYPYISDKEKQKVAITSRVIEEKQDIVIEILPQVQKLVLLLARDTERHLGLSHNSVAITCESFNISLIYQHDGRKLTNYISINLNISLPQIERLINSMEAIERIGTVRVFQKKIEFGTEHHYLGLEIIVIFVTRLGVEPSEVPVFKLEQDTSVDCLDVSTNSSFPVLAALKMTQKLTYAKGFKVGFDSTRMYDSDTTQRHGRFGSDNTRTQSQRFTPYLPLNISRQDFQMELTHLLTTQCDYSSLHSNRNIRILFNDSYESRGRGIDHSTAFCGMRSKRSPVRVWKDSNGLGNHRYVCFAFRGDFSGLHVHISYQPLQDRTILPRRTAWHTIDVSDSVPTNRGWSDFKCINVVSRVKEVIDTETHNLVITHIRFNYKKNFWIDEFFIASQEFTVTPTKFPPRPNGVEISRMTVTGGKLSQPLLVNRRESEETYSGSGPASDGSAPTDSTLESGSGSGSVSHDSRSGSDHGRDHGLDSNDQSGSDPGSDDRRHHGSRSDSNRGSGSDRGMKERVSVSDPQFSVIVSSFRVTYSVLECGYDIGLIQGYYSIDPAAPLSPEVKVIQIQKASKPVSGTFDISISRNTLHFIPANISAESLKYIMNETFPKQKGFEVTRSGSCAGYSWEVEWKRLGGDLPEIGVDGLRLHGSDVEVSTSTLVDGGVWFKPLRGDMTRVPKQSPQVNVVIGGVPSSCRGRNCAFEYVQYLTPVVHSVTPNEGRGGTNIIIQGSFFSNNTKEVSVVIGTAPCIVITNNSSFIECTASRHSAGWYRVIVNIEGKGQTARKNSSCFKYLLTLSSVSPNNGSISGGHVVTIRGEGFLQYTSIPSITNLPFHLGIPPLIRRLNLCPSYEAELIEHDLNCPKIFHKCVDSDLKETGKSDPNNGEEPDRDHPENRDFDSGDKSYSNSGEEPNRDHAENRTSMDDIIFGRHFGFPSSVSIAGSPCIIMEATVDHVSCIPLFRTPILQGNISVLVLSEKATLGKAYTVALEHTPIIHSVEPVFGPVTGGTNLSISGTSFGVVSLVSAVFVTVGGATCDVRTANATHITCVTSEHQPGIHPILVSTPSGIAVWESALNALEWGINGSETKGESGSGRQHFGTGREQNETGGRHLKLGGLVSLLPTFEYRLLAQAGGPLKGSVKGGTEIQISGGAFINGSTDVYIGGKPANILSIGEDNLVVLTPSLTRTASVYLKSRRRVDDLAREVFWSRNKIRIQVGDTVEWRWNLSVVMPAHLELQLEESPHNGTHHGTILRPSSFQQGLSYTFNKIGTYRFSIVVHTITKPIEGKVIVSKLKSSLQQIKVFVGGHEAKYTSNFGSHSRLKRDTHNGHQEQRSSAVSDFIDNTNCHTPPHFPRDNTLNILYSSCLTPIADLVKPNYGSRLGTVFKISGSGFSTVTGENEVRFGNQECVVLNSTANEISCVLNTTSNSKDLPRILSPLPLSLRVTKNNTGVAFIVDRNDTDIRLLPTIRNISPSSGSTKGGTDVIFSGNGFPDNTNGLLFLGFPCNVTKVTYTTIWCTTVYTGPARDFNISIHFIHEVSQDLTKSYVKSELMTICSDDIECKFSFSNDHTPQVVSVWPTFVDGLEPSVLILNGSGFSEISEENVVKVGDFYCNVTESNQTTIACMLETIPAGHYLLSLRIRDRSENRWTGYADIARNFNTIASRGSLISVTPTSGSILGGNDLVISGQGFHQDRHKVHVSIDNTECIVKFVNYTTVVCHIIPRTTARSEGTYLIRVVSNRTSIFGNVTYEFAYRSTPRVTGINPTHGRVGDTLVITGSFFNMNPNSNSVKIRVGNTDCNLASPRSNESILTCSLGEMVAGVYRVSVNVDSFGRAHVTNRTEFHYNLVIDNLSETVGSLAGQNLITLTGSGFDPHGSMVTICNKVCSLTTKPSSFATIECKVPRALPSSMNETSTEASIRDERRNKTCDVRVKSDSESYTLANRYTYLVDLTPRVLSVNRTRGGTQGGSPLLILGNGFSGNANVSIAGSECTVVHQNLTAIECVTEPRNQTIRALVQVHINGMGYALSGATFWYVDVWSSNFTWGGGPLPAEGDFVVINRTVVLDTKTPILKLLLIKGGELIFDRDGEDNQIELHAQNVLITSNGRLEVGTQDKPFLKKTQIVLYGHVLSTEIPIYGAKTLALRRGSIDMHGQPLNLTWTRLARTARSGDTILYLQDWVPWQPGGEIVIASTSFSQRENEKLRIVSVVAVESGSMLHLAVPLEYDHISMQQVIDGKEIDTSAEVGYLTRNIVFRGNVNKEWVENVTECKKEFRPGQFQVQTCFRGRFGNEMGSDQFGAQMFIHAAVPSQGQVTGRISYIEVTHAGQAFRLGRYPIHFHLNGNVSGSFVRGCGIHHTFNRAVTVHGVDYLLVEKNVAYDILGHAYFLEDGNEQFNIIQDNLGIFVRASSSLLNVDITPATFWVVNANNIVRRNAAAGGTHFGFWYRLPKNPTGPSFTRSMCPQKQRVLEFADNTAHSFGWYGLWVFRHYFPSPSGQCGDKEHAPAHFVRFLSWRNERGVEFGETGSVQLIDSVIMDNELAGVEIVELDSVWGKRKGPLISFTLIVGHSAISSDWFCTKAGIKTPKSYYLTVSNVTFVNFDRNDCYPITACSQCKILQGGFETRYEGIRYINSSSKLTRWKWEHEHIHRDLDGTLTMSQEPKLLIPTTGLLDLAQCRHHPESSDDSNPDGTAGSICNGSLKFGRLAIFRTAPSCLQFTTANFTNQHGTTTMPFVFKRLRGGPGYMAQLQLNASTEYLLTWLGCQSITNISYNVDTTGFGRNDYVIIAQHYRSPLDRARIKGVTMAWNASVLNPSTIASASTGDYIFENGTSLKYIVKDSQQFTYTTYKCLYKDCVPPPPPTLPPPIPLERPENGTQMWSDESTWPENRVPVEGQDVRINGSVYILLDIPTLKVGKLHIVDGATVELVDGIDHIIEADCIVLHGGRLVAGYPDAPFTNKVRIILHGNTSSPECTLGVPSPIIGAKAIGVFGELILNACPRGRTWTLLSETAFSGSNSISLVESVDWKVGDRIVITSTTFDAYQTEVFEIASISNDRRTLSFNNTLQNTHLGTENSQLRYSIRAEVGLLSRRIVIENGKPVFSDTEAFGCRVLVSRSLLYSGSAQVCGVEFKGCGQLGYTDDFDPRFALSFVGLGKQGTSYVKDCSFHDGYNTAIGVFETNSLQIEWNVIHSTVGPSMVLTGSHHNVTQNLASLSQFFGTFRERNELFNSLWTANYEIIKTHSLNFTGNHAAGGAKAGFHSRGEDCSNHSLSTIRENVAHSSLHCVHLGYEDAEEDCYRYTNFIFYSCHHYGLFSYSEAGIQIVDSTFINNKAAIYVSVIGPPSIGHLVGSKSVTVLDSIIVSAANQSSRCVDDAIVPDIARHPRSFSGIQSPTHGHVGIIIPSFVSSRSHFPKFTWTGVTSYPAISGLTSIKNTTFVNFALGCRDQRDVVIMTNPDSEDANHPVHLESISFASDSASPAIDESLKVYVHVPKTKRINPSDCVDMDCDGMKNVLLKDDGSFTESNGPRTLIPMAEIGWDGPDRRRGIGDFRIPRTMLTNPDGSRISVTNIYPKKGVVRGTVFGSDANCSFNPHWNMYLCSQLDHLMLVMESLDEDTETRRLSPISLGTNGFINLINGPMDNGWCGGYTCQERISTFFTIVASNFSYTVGLTSTNPQDFSLHLLNSNESQGIVVGIIYTNPQRLDVYVKEGDEYVYKTPEKGGLLPKPVDQSGTNFYNFSTKKLYITIRGNTPHKIVTTPIIMLSLTLAVTVDDFFKEEELVKNLATLLKISESNIKIVNIVREIGRKKKRSATQNIQFMIEIGNPPSNSTSVNATGSVNNTGDVGMSFEMLNKLSDLVADVVQTGQLNFSVVAVTVEKPIPPPVDPTGGVRATPDTGGPQPGDIPPNSSIPTFYDNQVLREQQEQNQSIPVPLSLPANLLIERITSTGVFEGLPLSGVLAPLVAMHDRNGALSSNLGLTIPWLLSARIESGGPSGAFFVGGEANFSHGEATFDNMVFSHPGDYMLSFSVTYPPTADFSVMSTTPLPVLPREFGLRITQQPRDGNTTFKLYPFPSVQLVDLSHGGAPVTNHTWRHTTWYVELRVQGTEVRYHVQLIQGVALFGDVKILSTGEYRMEFEAYEVSSSGQRVSNSPIMIVSETFRISEVPITWIVYTFRVNFNYVVRSGVDNFNRHFLEEFMMKYSSLKFEVANVSTVQGSIITTIYMAASTPDALMKAVDVVTDKEDPLTFLHGGVTLIPFSVVQEPAEPPTNNPAVLYAVTIPLIILTSCAIFALVVILFTYKHIKKHKVISSLIMVKPREEAYNYSSSPTHGAAYCQSPPPGYKSRPSTAGTLPPGYTSRPTTALGPLPPDYTSRPNTPATLSLSSVPLVFFSNPSLTTTDTADDGYGTIDDTKVAKAKVQGEQEYTSISTPGSPTTTVATFNLSPSKAAASATTKMAQSLKGEDAIARPASNVSRCSARSVSVTTTTFNPFKSQETANIRRSSETVQLYELGDLKSGDEKARPGTSEKRSKEKERSDKGFRSTSATGFSYSHVTRVILEDMEDTD